MSNWNLYKVGDRVVYATAARTKAFACAGPPCDPTPGTVVSVVSEMCGPGSWQEAVVKHDGAGDGSGDTLAWDVELLAFEDPAKRAQGAGVQDAAGGGWGLLGLGLGLAGVVGGLLWLARREADRLLKRFHVVYLDGSGQRCERDVLARDAEDARGVLRLHEPVGSELQVLDVRTASWF